MRNSPIIFNHSIIRKPGFILLILLVLMNCGETKKENLDPHNVVGLLLNVGLSSQKCRNYPKSQSSTYIATAGSNTTTSTGSIICTWKADTISGQCTESIASGSQLPTNFTGFYNSVADFVEEAYQIRNFKLKTDYSSPTVVSNTFTYDSQRRLLTDVNTNGGKASITYTEWDSGGRPTKGVYQDGTCNPTALTNAFDLPSVSNTVNLLFAGGAGVTALGGVCPSSTISIKIVNQYDENFVIKSKTTTVSSSGTPLSNSQNSYKTLETGSVCY
ncbi:MAG: hypothetical protein K8R21_02850 [Leptospira sp.]|nr:hypothetical protein [Leptospira sp.]